METRPICIAKLGGSLLASPNLPERLRAWLDTEVASHPEVHYVLIAGGGRLVDAVREIDARTPLGDEAAHWIAIELLDATARIMGAMLPELPIVDDYTELLQRTANPGVTILRPWRFMREIEPKSLGQKLPASWAVTSDSIAARLAVVLGAEELVLIKSTPPPIEATKNFLGSNSVLPLPLVAPTLLPLPLVAPTLLPLPLGEGWGEGDSRGGPNPLPKGEGIHLIALSANGYVDHFLPLLADELPKLRLADL
ncbi:MAG: hypothetical protein L0Z07_08830 [Planctomycetes bacterium]|nr:hypothetical protein [Planctomycetota bacterium]